MLLICGAVLLRHVLLERVLHIGFAFSKDGTASNISNKTGENNWMEEVVVVGREMLLRSTCKCRCMDVVRVAVSPSAVFHIGELPLPLHIM